MTPHRKTEYIGKPLRFGMLALGTTCSSPNGWWQLQRQRGLTPGEAAAAHQDMLAFTHRESRDQAWIALQVTLTSVRTSCTYTCMCTCIHLYIYVHMYRLVYFMKELRTAVDGKKTRVRYQHPRPPHWTLSYAIEEIPWDLTLRYEPV